VSLVMTVPDKTSVCLMAFSKDRSPRKWCTRRSARFATAGESSRDECCDRLQPLPGHGPLV